MPIGDVNRVLNNKLEILKDIYHDDKRLDTDTREKIKGLEKNILELKKYVNQVASGDESCPGDLRGKVEIIRYTLSDILIDMRAKQNDISHDDEDYEEKYEYYTAIQTDLANIEQAITNHIKDYIRYCTRVQEVAGKIKKRKKTRRRKSKKSHRRKSKKSRRRKRKGKQSRKKKY